MDQLTICQQGNNALNYVLEDIKKMNLIQTKTIEEKDQALTDLQQQIKDLQENIQVLLANQRIKMTESKLTDSFDENTQTHLEKVASDLASKWKEWFEIKTYDHEKSLMICNYHQPNIEDEQMKEMLKDLVSFLQENNILTLFELKISCYQCNKLTEGSFKTLATAISTQSFSLKSLDLNFNECSTLTEDSFKNLVNAIFEHSFHLQSLSLSFRMCDQLTDESFKHLATLISKKSLHLQDLSLDFSCMPTLSDLGIEPLATAIQNSPFNIKFCQLNFFPRFDVEDEVVLGKRELLAQKFKHVPNLAIL